MDIILEVDTGARIGIINYDSHRKLSWKLKVLLVDLHVMLCGYSGNVMKARGKFEVVFEYESIKN